MDLWGEVRFFAQVANDAHRVLICEPDRAEAVRALVASMGASGTFEVRASPACPPGKILVLDEPALTAAANQTAQRAGRDLGLG